MGRQVPAALSIAVVALAAAYFAPLGDFTAANPLPGQEWMKRHTGLALGVFALVTLAAGALAWQRRERTQDASTDQAFDPRADGYLDDLRKRMKVIWIDEFLSQSLERIVPAKLGFAERARCRSCCRCPAAGTANARSVTPTTAGDTWMCCRCRVPGSTPAWSCAAGSTSTSRRATGSSSAPPSRSCRCGRRTWTST
uniref:Uncharacterized protein n=1 Tax=uncultured bacterium esnapd4 TaxID=1366610 RepID=S5UBU4_9BACT|nr:hypothetical protein [uncultured bacterium esnapd4]